MKQLVILLSVALAACAPAHVDTRTLETQKADFSYALKQLAGEYVVVNSLNDPEKYSRLNVIATKTGTMAFQLSGSKRESLYASGTKCSGRSMPDGTYPGANCSGDLLPNLVRDQHRVFG